MKNKITKRAVIAVVFIFGLAIFTSCRSTSKSCGLASTNTITQTTLQQA